MNDNGTLTLARGANEQAAYMITQVSYSISTYFFQFSWSRFYYSSQIRELRREKASLKWELQNFKADETSLLENMNNYVRKFVTAPAVRINSKED